MNVLGADSYRLPEYEENHKLDTQYLQKRLVRGQLRLQLHIKLNNAEHGDGHCQGIKCLSPDVSESRAIRRLAVYAPCLSSDRDDGEEDADEAVLEDTDPNDLKLVSFSATRTCQRLSGRTLNHVNPLRGTLSMPLLCPPVSFCAQFTGHTQFFGVMPRKNAFCWCKSGAR